MNTIQSDLRFLLPILPEQKVLVVGNYSVLAEAIADTDANLVLLMTSDHKFNREQDSRICVLDGNNFSFPLAAKSVSHILAPMISNHSISNVFISEAFRILKPGGWIFFGLRSTSPLSQYPFVAAVQRMLTSHQKEINQVALFGVYPGLNRPRYLIPLDHHGPTYHFYKQKLVPRSYKSLLFQRIGTLFAKLGLHKMLFDNLGFIVQKL